MATDYEQIYKDLGIVVAPLSKDYDPEIYGRELMRGIRNENEISYSSSTNYIPKTANNVNNNNKEVVLA